MSENHSDKNADKEDDENDDRNLNSLSGSGVRRRLVRNGIEFFSGIGFYALGDDCTNWGLIYWGFFFHYLCIVTGALIVTEHALALWPQRKSLVRGAYIGFCVVLACFYIRLSWPRPAPVPAPPPKPHFALGVKLEGSRDMPTLLTNESIQMPEGLDPAKFISQFVVLPERPFAGNVSMSFAIINDFSNALESIEAVASFRSNWFIFGSGWQDVTVFGSGGGFSNVDFKIPSLYAHNMTYLPNIIFPTPTMNRVLIFDVGGAKIPTIQHPDVIEPLNLTVTANDVKRTQYSFFVMALPTTNTKARPIVVPPSINLADSNWIGIDKSNAINIFNTQK